MSVKRKDKSKTTVADRLHPKGKSNIDFFTAARKRSKSKPKTK